MHTDVRRREIWEWRDHTLLREYLLMDNPEPGVSYANEGLSNGEEIGKEGIRISGCIVFLTPIHHLSIDTPGDGLF